MVSVYLRILTFDGAVKINQMNYFAVVAIKAV